MASVNKKVVTNDQTYEGAPAVSISAVQQLERSVMSCLLWEDTFYEDGELIVDRLRRLVQECPSAEVSRITIQAKQDMRLRQVPLLLARELARTKEGRKELKNVIPHIITRVDDITEILAMYFQQKKKHREPAKLPNQLKKYLGESFIKFDEYNLAKYNGGKKSVSLKDAIRLVHPMTKDLELSALWKRVLKDELATPDTWEVEISKSSNKMESWRRLLLEKKLGGLAMLRNIRNIREAGVNSKLIWKGIHEINAGKLLPINFISAATHNPQFEPIIEKKFLECFANKPKLGGETVILVDVSGSMDDKLSGRGELKRIDVACSLAMIGAELFENLRVFSFSTAVQEVPVRRGFALRDAIVSSQPHGGTALGAAVRTITQHLGKDIRLIVITDEQSNDPVEQHKGYMINVASNKNGVGYRQWTHIDGWSDKVLSYIIQMETQNDER